jgi:hypothetical protein
MMTSDEKDRVIEALGGLAVVLGEEVSAKRLQGYLALLEDLPVASIEAAALRLGASWKGFKFPNPAEIRELCEGSPNDAAAKAWVQLQNSYRKAGASMSVLFEDGAIGKAIEDVFGGWVACCDAFHPVYRTADEANWEERQAARLERREVVGRQVQIGGLSPEMIRAKQKEFDVAYRRAQREGKTAPAYYPGECEIENRRTVGSWTKGQATELADGRKVLVQKIHVQGEEGRSVDAEFDFHTAALLTPLRELLERTPAKALPPKREQRLIGAGAEMLAPEQGRELVKGAISELLTTTRMTSVSPAPLSEEEFTKRREALQSQAATLNPLGAAAAAMILREQFIQQQGSNLAAIPTPDEPFPEDPFPEELPEAFRGESLSAKQNK